MWAPYGHFFQSVYDSYCLFLFFVHICDKFFTATAPDGDGINQIAMKEKVVKRLQRFTVKYVFFYHPHCEECSGKFQQIFFQDGISLHCINEVGGWTFQH
jgi:hypothetical protein